MPNCFRFRMRRRRTSKHAGASAHLFLLAGSPGRAADMFRQILRQEHDHDDADAYAGLGEAEIAQGNYRIAETNLQMAAHLKPGDEDIRKRLELARQVLALDPMLRGLGTAERYRRTRELVQLALNDVNQCAGRVSGTLREPGRSSRASAPKAGDGFPAGRCHRSQSGSCREVMAGPPEELRPGDAAGRRTSQAGSGQGFRKPRRDESRRLAPRQISGYFS